MSSLQTTAARTPAWRFAAIETPIPVPHTSMPRARRPLRHRLGHAVREVRVVDRLGRVGAHVLALGRRGLRAHSLTFSLRSKPAWSEPRMIVSGMAGDPSIAALARPFRAPCAPRGRIQSRDHALCRTGPRRARGEPRAAGRGAFPELGAPDERGDHPVLPRLRGAELRPDLRAPDVVHAGELPDGGADGRRGRPLRSPRLGRPRLSGDCHGVARLRQRPAACRLRVRRSPVRRGAGARLGRRRGARLRKLEGARTRGGGAARDGAARGLEARRHRHRRAHGLVRGLRGWACAGRCCCRLCRSRPPECSRSG